MTTKLTSALLIALSPLLLPLDAYPCGNAVYLRTDDATRLIAKAEKAVQGGQYKKALKLLDSEEYELEEGNPALLRRWRLVTAVAQLRTGKADPSVTAFRWLLEKDAKDPFLRTRLGEALSMTGEGKAEALRILETLEKDDLMADADGWGALARLRHKTGDEAGRARASARCRQIAKKASICPSFREQKTKAPVATPHS